MPEVFFNQSLCSQLLEEQLEAGVTSETAEYLSFRLGFDIPSFDKVRKQVNKYYAGIRAVYELLKSAIGHTTKLRPVILTFAVG